MRSILLIATLLTLTLLPASQAFALSADENKLIDNITAFNQSLEDQSSGPKGTAGAEQVKAFNKCASAALSSRAVKKKLKIKKNRNFMMAISLGLWVNEIVIASNRVYKEDYLQEAASLDNLAVADPTVLAASKAGAARLRNLSTFYTKPRSTSPGCFIIKTLLRQPQWNLKTYGAAYLKGMGWTPVAAAAFGKEDSKLEPPLKAGYNKLKADGASKDHLEDYQDLFTLDSPVTIRFNSAKQSSILQRRSLGLAG